MLGVGDTKGGFLIFFCNYLHICIFFHNLAVEIIPKTLIHMERIKKIVRFYINGFKNMTWGKELWILIIIKLVIMFGILRLFFFHPVARPLPCTIPWESVFEVFTLILNHLSG